MCGVVGFLSNPTMNASEMRRTCENMNDTLRHRGPDGFGIWIDPESGMALGHRRLSIVDLSVEGSQPMASGNGRYVISFNGEIYNFLELRKELEAHEAQQNFRGHSDTEVMLACITSWGLTKAVEKFVGMFAFALWDRQERELYLVRDRMGVKPLYYAICRDTLIFASELKALLKFPGFSADINRDALCLYFRYHYIPAPHTIYLNCHKLEQGFICKIKPGTVGSVQPEISLTKYWTASKVWSQPHFDLQDISEKEITYELEKRLDTSVRLRMISDVPLGAFLSGGIDSSTVVSLMQLNSKIPVRTFTIGYKEGSYNEANYAEAIARHLGTHHTTYTVTERDALDVIPEIPRIWDEPFADVSQIPTYMVSALARTDVTVALSGDGGDELFAGYDRYEKTIRIWKKLHNIPYPARKVIASLLKVTPECVLDGLAAPIGTYLQKKGYLGSSGKIGLKLHQLAGMLSENRFWDLYTSTISYEVDPGKLVKDGNEPDLLLDKQCISGDELQSMLYWDANTYLADDLLTKIDRASMSVGLEARTPILDHRVVEFAARIPNSLRFRGGKGKQILRNILKRYVPEELFDRPKMGFGVPIDSWLAGELREWCEVQLSPGKLKNQGYLNAHRVTSMWKRYLSGESNWQYNIWSVLMFQSWLDAQHG